MSESDDHKPDAIVQRQAKAPEGAVTASQFTDTRMQTTWEQATESNRTSDHDSATMIALSDEIVAKIKQDGSYQKFELYDSKEQRNGSAQDTGTVIDYKPQEVQKNKSFLLGMDYEEGRDVRTPTEKLQDFLKVTAQNASNPEHYTQYLQSELDKVIGIAEGLNKAKEETKTGVASAWNALTDGSVAAFLSKPNAINDPLFDIVGSALNAMSRDPHALNNATLNAVEALGNAILSGNDYYNSASDREKGHVIGHTAFALANPEGSTKSGEAALKFADTIAIHVDARVIKTVEQSLETIRKAPEVGADIKKALYEYIKTQGLSGPELEAAGVPRGFFSEIEQTTGTGDSLLSMAKNDGLAPNLSGKGGDWPVINERPSLDVVRQSDSYSCVSAVGEMLSEGSLTETELVSKIGEPGKPVPTQFLAKHLGPDWIVRAKDDADLDDLLKGGSWGTELRELMVGRYARLEPSHAIVVDGLDDTGRIMVRDPAHGTRYEMTRENFLKHWTGIAVYRK